MSSIMFAAVACSVVMTWNASAQGDEPTPSPAKEFFPQPTEREVRLDAVLDQHLSIEFTDMPLSDVANWFSGKLETAVVLDHRSLEDAGIGSDTPVTREVDGISARAALKLVLDDMDLTCLEQDGVLLVTTQDKAETELFTRVYPVGDLTPLVPREVPYHRGGGMMGGGNRKAGEEPPAKSTVAAAPPVANELAQPPRMVPDFDSLIEVMTTTVKPQTWDEVGGPGSISELVAAKSIVISQTREVHDEVLELLRALRAAKQAGDPAESE